MARHRLFVVPGTWEAVAAANGDPKGITPGAEIGMLRGVTDHLDRTIFDVVYVNYPESFGPVAGGGESLLAALGNPSYRKSRDMGVAEVRRLIGNYDGTFGLLGFSQGAAVVSLVGRELLSGKLKHRLSDCLWVHAVASPHRGLGRTFPLGNRLAGQGISGDNVTNTGGIDWFDYCLPGDIYSDANLAQTYLQLAYDLSIDLSVTDPDDMVAGMGESLRSGALRRAIADLHESPAIAASKSAITAGAIAWFKFDKPHGKYGTREIVPGWTALGHSAEHLNNWGAQLPGKGTTGTAYPWTYGSNIQL